MIAKTLKYKKDGLKLLKSLQADKQIIEQYLKECNTKKKIIQFLTSEKIKNLYIQKLKDKVFIVSKKELQNSQS